MNPFFIKFLPCKITGIEKLSYLSLINLSKNKISYKCYLNLIIFTINSIAINKKYITFISPCDKLFSYPE